MKRLDQVRQLLIQQSLDALLISSVPDIIYLAGYSNFSTEEREAYIFITKYDQFILTDGRYSTAIKNKIKQFDLIEISGTNSLKNILNKLKIKHQIQKLGIDENIHSIKEYKLFKTCFNDLNHQSIQTLRAVKDLEEISSITAACRLGDKAFKYILTKIKPGITEKELAFELEFFIRKQGADISFKPIIAFGANAAIPHHNTGDQRLASPKPGEGGLILLDFGVKYENYCSDMTRTVFLGKITEEQKRVYNTVLSAQQRAVDYITDKLKTDNRLTSHYARDTRGTSTTEILNASAVDKVSREYIISQGYPSIPHSLGHGIGLQVHEPPSLSPKSKSVLAEGMVFSIEPGIYLPGKFGIRIEDLFTIANGKLIQLTNSPKEIITL